MGKLTDAQMAGLTTQLQEFMILYEAIVAGKGGLQPTFFGQYRQAPKKSIHIQTFPFLIAQNPEERKLLESGEFMGRAYELGIQASVKGIITPAEVEFEKTYIPKTDELGGGESHPIFYKGFRRNEGVYEGTWSFEDNGGDMQTRGKFLLNRINDFEKFKRELEKLCTGN